MEPVAQLVAVPVELLWDQRPRNLLPEIGVWPALGGARVLRQLYFFAYDGRSW